MSVEMILGVCFIVAMIISIIYVSFKLGIIADESFDIIGDLLEALFQMFHR